MKDNPRVKVDRRKRPRSILGNEERWYLFRMILLIALVYFIRREIRFYETHLLVALPIVLAMAMLIKVFVGNERVRDQISDQITLLPIIRAEGGEKLFIPRMTILLILLNVLVHYVLKVLTPEAQLFVHDHFVFLPYKIEWWNGLLSSVTSSFLHSSAGHLWGNMTFLWAFGPAVEERVGAKSFLFLYVLTDLVGGLLLAFVASHFFGIVPHSLGASGAVSGIMGVFMVRCYFKKLVIPLPFFGMFYYKLRINSLIPLGYFLLLDIACGTRQLARGNSGIAYWAHIGSLVAGAFLAFLFKQHIAAAGEKYAAIGADTMRDPNFHKDGEGVLRYALELDPQNLAVMLDLARKKARARLPEGREKYEKIIRKELLSNPKKAAEIYKEYLTAYNRILEPKLQYRLAQVLHRQGDMEAAMRSMELIADEPSVQGYLRERALSQLVTMLHEAGLYGPTRHRIEQFAVAFPMSPLLQAAQRKLSLLAEKAN